jgi:hypothetical protein
MSTPDSSIHLLGLTGTGKTNFLVALDVILDNQSDPNGLVHGGLAEDRAYIQPLKEKWLRGEVFDRTIRSQPPPPHQLLLQHPASGTLTGLNIPDLAGETFDAEFVTRSIPLELWNRLEDATGILLFIHCDHNADHTILEEPCFMDEGADAKDSQATVPDSASDWRLEDACIQVKLVDLLQFLSEGNLRKQPLRIAVMISAWDLVEKARAKNANAAKNIPKAPDDFLNHHWPLLKQYLENQTGVFEFNVYGVSARGGGDSEADIKRLTSLDHPSDRVLLVDGAHRSHDLTRPIRWLLNISDLPAPAHV